jgi:hypothetical protein
MDMQISLSPDLIAKIEREANARGVSPQDFVRESLEKAVDPLFADTAVCRDEGPADFASKHDDYLYGDAS